MRARVACMPCGCMSLCSWDFGAHRKELEGILTSSKQLCHKMMRRSCPGHKEHEATGSKRVTISREDVRGSCECSGMATS